MSSEANRLGGIDNNLKVPAPVDIPYDGSATLFPNNLSTALTAFEQSSFYRGCLGDAFVNFLCHIKKAEWQRYLNAVSEWEQREYFSLF